VRDAGCGIPARQVVRLLNDPGTARLHGDRRPGGTGLFTVPRLRRCDRAARRRPRQPSRADPRSLATVGPWLARQDNR
jgi:hypothetical protein